MNYPIAIIGGSGIYDPQIPGELDRLTVRTPYGDVPLLAGTVGQTRVCFLARHGQQHSLPPHRVNYRANIAALKVIGVRRILATAAVGAMNREMFPGSIVLVDQFIDFTKNRPLTFYDGGDSGVVHTDFSTPYCAELRQLLYDTARSLNYAVFNGGTYICTEGPRFETAAEIRFYAGIGGDVVGMTSVPEVILAREAGICYAALSVVTNAAAGIALEVLSHQEVLEVMAENAVKLRQLLYRALPQAAAALPCRCVEGIPSLTFKGEIVE